MEEGRACASDPACWAKLLRRLLRCRGTAGKHGNYVVRHRDAAVKRSRLGCLSACAHRQMASLMSPAIASTHHWR